LPYLSLTHIGVHSSHSAKQVTEVIFSRVKLCVLPPPPDINIVTYQVASSE